MVLPRQRRPQRVSISEEIRLELTKALGNGSYALGDKLPSEHELADAYGASRATLREILSGLERDGLIRKVHGVGTFVTAPERQVRNSLHLDVGVTEGLSATKVPSEVRLLGQLVQTVPPWMADRLELNGENSALRVERMVYVDGAPAAHVVDVIPVAVLDLAGTPEYREGSIYAFLERDCSIELHGGLADIVPVLPNASLARHLGCARNVPLLRLEQTEHDRTGRIVLFSQEHYLPGVITLTVRRERAAGATPGPES